MNYSQKYSLVSFLEPVEIGAEFTMTDWPPHITIADVFAIELESGVEQQLKELLLQESAISVSAGDDATLGTTNVVLINKNDKLQSLHDRVIDILEINNATFNTPEFTREGFLPHSTIQKLGRLHAGDKVTLKSVSLIDMFPARDWQQRKVLSVFALVGV